MDPQVSAGKLRDVIKEWQGGFNGVPKVRGRRKNGHETQSHHLNFFFLV